MFELNDTAGLTKEQTYAEVLTAARGLFAGERDPIANMANLAALLFQSVPQLNWAGFYVLRHGELVLGPFQGKPACIRIPLGKGVCGAAAEQRRTQVVDDVHAFPGHIACDAASRAEIVVPLLQSEILYGVLDLDSPDPGRFDQQDRQGLEPLAQLLVEGSDLTLLHTGD